MNPFDVVSSLVKMKESVYTTEFMFEKDYNTFMVNRILSNDPRTVLFADVMNQYSILDKKLQHDFYLFGIPQYSGRIGYAKKTNDPEFEEDCIRYLMETMHLNASKAIEYMSLIGIDKITEEIAKKGGRTLK